MPSSAPPPTPRWAGRHATEDRWDRFVDKAKEEQRLQLDYPTAVPYYSNDSVWKRNVYTFVLSNTKTPVEANNLRRYTEELIAGNVQRRLPRTPSFEANHFHWVFSALSAAKDWEIDRNKVFRFGRQLLYAERHHVPVEFLIGFLHQTGSPNHIEAKVKQGGTEIWRDAWIATLALSVAKGK